MSRLSGRLEDILEAIDNIECYAAQGRGAFEQDELIQVWMLHHLRIIGEAVRVVKPELEGVSSEIPWSSIIGMRNILIHHYFAVDTELVWRVIEDKLGPLKQVVTDLLEKGV